MIKKNFVFVIMLLLLAALAACGGGPAGGPGAAEEPMAATSDGEVQLAPELRVYNWTDYIDEEVIAEYEAIYGVKIIYDTFASNEDLLAKLQTGAGGYDVIFPSDYMVKIMSDLNLLRELDKAQLPNISNLDPDLLDPPFDPGNQYCLPYQWGTTGLGYRIGHPYFESNPPDSWAYLFDPAILEKYAQGGITVLNDPREVTAAALMYLGYSPNSIDSKELAQAQEIMLQAKPFWKVFSSEDYAGTLMVPDEVVLAHGFSGDIWSAFWDTYNEATEIGNWQYVIPKEGAIRWMDNMCVSVTTDNYETALHFMNFLLLPEVAAKITNYTYFASPNVAANEYIEPEILEDRSIYPTEEVQERLHWLVDLEDGLFLYDEIWTSVKGQ